MPKQTKKSKEERLAQDRLQKKLKYAEIKKDPEKYAIQKEKERARYLKRKEQNKIKSSKDMTPRQLRNQRKRWRENAKRHYEKQKKERKIQQLLIDDSPPTTDRENQATMEEDPLEGPSGNKIELKSKTCKRCLRNDKILNRLRYRHRKVIGSLKQEIDKLKKEKDAVRKMLYRVTRKNKIEESKKKSTGKKIDEVIKLVNVEQRDNVRKKLIFGEILSRSVKDGFKSLNNKGKRQFSDVIMKDKESFKKHKLLTEVKSFTVGDKKNNITIDDDNLKQKIKEFFEDDCVSRIAADKKEYITIDKIRMQKRYLTDTLCNLHKKFLTTQNLNVSYSTFCKNRPKWVLFPKESDRNTCACKIHVNIDLLVQCLHAFKILKETNGTGILESLCCDINNEACMNRSCGTCKYKSLDYGTFSNDEKIKYEKWCSTTQKYFIKDQEKIKKITSKQINYDFPRNILKQLEYSIKSYMNHCSNILTQYRALKLLKETISPQEAVLHVDFSENYCVKFNEEIQSFHFGGSRGQISLHTCVIYLIDPEVGIKKEYSFCTVSDCTQHDASAVWAHLVPTISYILEVSPLINTIHFISDSPSSQYRNRYIFYMISQLYLEFSQLKHLTWNYLEAGHGKGAPDGIGAVLKRTADQLVRFGHDIDSLEQFLTIQTRVNVKIRIVTHDDIRSRHFPSNIMPVKGTMSMHQIIWSFGCHQMTVRKLSCFLCENGVICQHGKHMTFVDVFYSNDVSPHHLQQFIDENTTPEFLQEVTDQPELHSKSFVISEHDHHVSKIPVKNSVSNEKFSIGEHESDNAVSIPELDRKSTQNFQNSKIKILSNIRVDDWTNVSFYKQLSKKPEFNETYQSDFEKFINETENKKKTESNKENKIRDFWLGGDSDNSD